MIFYSFFFLSNSFHAHASLDSENHLVVVFVDWFCDSGHNYIGSEHLLLGLLREGEGVAARVLENLGADPSNIRTQASNFPILNWFEMLFLKPKFQSETTSLPSRG